MTRGRPLGALALLTILSSVPVLAGEFVAKTYEYRPNVRLEVGLDLGGGLRLDSIEFEIPEDPSGRFTLDPRAKVEISNLGDESRRVGIAIALEDAEGRLVAAGTGGTKLFPLRAGRQMAYAVPLGDVHSRIGSASAFRISLETD